MSDKTYDVPAEWAYISKYSPYQNVKAGVKYPRVLFTTSTRDDRVHPGHARKMAAVLQARQACALPNLLRIEHVKPARQLVITDKNLMEQVPSPFGRGTQLRLSSAVFIAAHTNDHYGQMVVYGRMNGVIPPSSQPRPRPAGKAAPKQ